MSLLIVTPSLTAKAADARGGNRTSALRWAAMWRSLGHRVRIAAGWEESFGADVVLALHARRSAEAVARAHAAGVIVLLALTGTDLYHDVARSDPRALESLRLADRLIVLQPLAVEAVPEEHRHKARPILQSARPAARRAMLEGFAACVVGHLREVKDPLLAARAARSLAPDSRVIIHHAGGAIDPRIGDEARREMRDNHRYRWLGELGRHDALALIAGARVLVHSSTLEGGANAVGEAIACGTAVLASRIDGSVGLLGADYVGYFEAGDAASLARLLDRCERDPSFLALLSEQVRALRAQFDPERERAAWRALIDELPRVRIVTAPGAGEKDAIDELAADVTSGLARADKHLHCRWFYDAEGSRLFEEICQQPEYYLPRAEREILSRHARDIVARCPPDSTLCELGSGSASKTRLVIEAMIARSGDGRYVPVDISPAALHESGADLALRYPSLRVLGIVGEYDHALPELWRRVPPPRLMLWLGSNIGNLDRAAATEFLGRLARRMTSDDRLLVGLDLRKDRRVLERAYDDAAGVTARFNLNLLARINRDLGADFDLGAFEHRASYDELDGRIDMWLVSRRDQRVTIGRSASILELHAGETIHTERSFKHHEDEIRAMVSAAGLEMMDAWLDDQRQFVDVLLANKGTI